MARVLVLGLLTLLFASAVHADASLIARQDSFHWYNQAKYYTLQRPDYPRALECVQMALKVWPANQRARTLKEWLERKIAEQAPVPPPVEVPAELPALSSKETLLEETPTPAEELAARLARDLHLRLGEDLLVRGEHARAREEFVRDLKENPDRQRSMFYIFKHTVDNGEWLKGMLLLQRMLDRGTAESQLEPEMKDVILYQLQQYQAAMFLAKAMRTVNRDISTKKLARQSYPWKTLLPDLPETSEIRLELKNVDSLDIELFKRLRALPPGFPGEAKDFYIDRDGNIYPRYNFFREKQEIILPRISRETREKKDVDHLLDQGDYFASIGSYDRALKFYRDARRLDPSSAMARNNIGVVHKIKGRLDEAIEEFKAAIALEPSYSEPVNNLAVVYAEIGELSEALKLLQIARRLNRVDPRIHFNLGLAYEKKGERKAAMEQYRAALEIQPTLESAIYRLGKLHLERKDKREALRYFRRLQRIIDRETPEYQDLLRLIRSLSE